MIIRNLRKQLAIALCVLLLTMLPFGFYGTNFGQTCALFSLVLFTGSYVFYVIAKSINSKLNNNQNLFVKLSVFQDSIGRFLFHVDEKKFRLLVFFINFLISAIIGKILWDSLPVLEDSSAQYAHSHILAIGYFSVPNHQLHEFFPMIHVMTDGAKWYSQYLLGHLLMLAIGQYLGFPYLICPILTGFSALFLYLFAYDNYGMKIARITALLTMICTQWWLMGSEYMNHNTSLFGCLLFVWSWLRMLKTNEHKYCLASGFGAGIAIITRPISAIPVILPFALYGLLLLWRSERKIYKLILLLSSMTIAFILVACQLYFNLETTGDIFLFASQAIYGDQVAYGFGHIVTSEAFNNFYKNTTHDIWRGIAHLSNNLVGTNVFLFGWPIPSLIFAILGICIFKQSVVTKLMNTSIILLSLAHIPYFYQDFAFGARYLYEISGFLIIASAIGIVKTPYILRYAGVKTNITILKYKLNLLVAAISILGILSFSLGFPRKYSNSQYENLGLSTEQIISQFPNNSLVFADKYYSKLVIFMPPLDSNSVIYAIDRGAENQKLINFYPKRTVFIETENRFKKIKDGEQ